MTKLVVGVILSTLSCGHLQFWLPRTIVTRPWLSVKEKVLTQFPVPPMAGFFQEEKGICRKLPKQTNRNGSCHLKRCLLGSPRTNMGMPVVDCSNLPGAQTRFGRFGLVVGKDGRLCHGNFP
jgi:hypothetical protein